MSCPKGVKTGFLFGSVWINNILGQYPANDKHFLIQDPLEAQPSRLGIQRSRMSNPSNSQPNSRNSNRLAQKSRSLEEGHHNDDYTSQVQFIHAILLLSFKPKQNMKCKPALPKFFYMTDFDLAKLMSGLCRMSERHCEYLCLYKFWVKLLATD